MTAAERDFDLDLDDELDEVLREDTPPGALDGERPLPGTPEEEHVLQAGAIGVLRRGIAVTPELRQGVVLTLLMAVAGAGGKLAVPILIQQILTRACWAPTASGLPSSTRRARRWRSWCRSCTWSAGSRTSAW